MAKKASAEKAVRDIRRKTRRPSSSIMDPPQAVAPRASSSAVRVAAGSVVRMPRA